MTTTIWQSILTIAVLGITISSTTSVVNAGGLQSGPSSGAFYAGGMILDKINNQLFLTGIHYNDAVVASTSTKVFAGNAPQKDSSSCYVASMSMDLSTNDEAREHYTFDGVGDWTDTVHPAASQEVCTSLAFHRPSQVVVLGTKQDSGSSNTNSPVQSGSMAVYDRSNIQNKQLTQMTLVSQDDRTNQLIYPVAVVPDSRSKDYLYMVVLASTDAQDNTSNYSGAKYPDWLKYQPYGSSFEMHVSKIKLSQGGSNTFGGFDGIPTGSITASKEWTTEFPLDDSSKGNRVFIGGILHKVTADNQDLVVVVGSTRGQGQGYGLSDGDDEDGFVTVIDPSSGEILGEGAREGSATDDIVTGLCDDPSDPEHFFIVGGTLGLMGQQQGDLDSVQTSSEMLQPFLRQIKADRYSSDDDNLWTVQWAVAHQQNPSKPAYGSAIDCVVDGDFVYVAGTVDDGAGLVQADSLLESQGGDDVWIAKIDKNSQKVHWMTQFGTPGDDRLARYGGITVDKTGHPILYGDTTGSLYRERNGDEDPQVVDMFVMTIDKTSGSTLKDEKYLQGFYGGVSTKLGVEHREEKAPDPTPFPTETPEDDNNDNNDNNDNDNNNDASGGVAPGSPTYYPTYLTDFPTNPDGSIPSDDEIAEIDDDDDDEPDDDEPADDGKIPIDEATKQQDIAAILGDSSHLYKPIGLQISGQSHAGGLVYDSQENTALLTGGTYVEQDKTNSPNSLCFAGVVDLSTGNLEVRNPLGSDSQQETCAAISFDTNRNAAYALGIVPGQTGMVLQMNENAQLLGGSTVGEYPSVYPVSIVTHPRDMGYVFVASMASTNGDANKDYSESTQWLDTDNLKFGSDFFLTIDRYKVTDVPKETASPTADLDQAPQTLEHNWVTEYETDDGEVRVGGMVMAGNGNVLVVVGSTRGSGGPFETNDGDNNDMDGFILKIDPEDGQLLRVSNGAKASTRLDSVNAKDDWILNVCNDRFDHDAFYVVGKSMGKIHNVPDGDQPPEGSTHAYVAKVSLKTLGAQWLKHFTMTTPNGGTPTHAEALSCTVTPDSSGQNIVYVGGTVRDGAAMDRADGDGASFGKDDIFVAAMNGETGDMYWIEQIGTPANDRLAAGQGLDVDSFGNAIVFGETEGSFYDENNNSNTDLVVLTINKKDGSYLTPRTEGTGVGDDEKAKPDAVKEDPAVVDESSSSLIIPSNRAPPSGVAAIQTSEDKIPSYAGGMHYDSYTNAVYLTGATYTSDNKGLAGTSQCIFAIATLPQFQFKQRESIGTRKAPESCNAISLANVNGKSEAIVVGSSEPSGLMNELRNGGKAKQYGMVMDLANKGGNYEMIGGTVVDAEVVQYPVKVITDKEKVFVVSMASRSEEVQSDSERADGRKYPNFTMGGVSKYGTQYEILVERHTINHPDDVPSGSMESTMNLDWRKPLETADGKSIYVSGMAVIDQGDALVVVGSTQGNNEGDDFDGIMAKVSTDTGAFASEGEESRSVAYFASVSGRDDWILSVCPDPNDDKYFFITGATGGEMDDSVSKPDADVTVHAVVSKIETSTLNIVWTTQFEVTHSSGVTDKEAASVALGCAAVPGKDHLYVAGDVENGAVLEGASESAGGDDIFVAMLDTSTGDKIWTKQVGSNGDDRIARGGGIVVDGNGNAVVYGDTTGDFHRTRAKRSAHNSDLFLMVFNQEDGTHTDSQSDKSTALGRKKSVDSDSAPSEWFGKMADKMSPNLIGLIAGASIAAALFLLCSCLLRRHRRSKAELIKKNSIFTYLQKFSVEDLDLRKSPAGGWHGTYLGKLAHGINSNANLPESPYRDEDLDDDDAVLFESAKRVHSSNRSRRTKGSLFSDSLTPGLGSSYRNNDDEGLKTRENSSRENKFSIV